MYRFFKDRLEKVSDQVDRSTESEQAPSVTEDTILFIIIGSFHDCIFFYDSFLV